ncbi:MAG: MFS transporter [Deltaproteobacteria bacterium]|nr:MFS transporter [Deltaproteobacteria bacterium]
MPPHPDTSPAPAASLRHAWLALTGVGSGVLMATLDASIVNIALPSLEESLHTDFATVQWVILSYTLVLTSFMLVMARLGDMRGKKIVYQSGMALFVIGSALCGLSPAVGWLIAARAFQGLGAVLMQSQGPAIVTALFPSEHRGKALGVMGSIVSVGLAMGPPLGGILIAWVGWRAIFLVNVPLGLLGSVLVWRFVPTLPPLQTNQEFDLAGAVILLVTLTAYSLGLTAGQTRGFTDVAVLALLAMTLVGGWGFIKRERTCHQPMVDLTLFRRPDLSLSLCMSFIVFTLLGTFVLLPFFCERVLGFSPRQTGVIMMVLPLSMGLISPVAGFLADRRGATGIRLAGLATTALACVLASTLHVGSSAWEVAWKMAPLGLGMGMFQSPNNSTIMGTAPPHRLGVVSGLLSLARTLGNTSGVPLLTSVFAALVWRAAAVPPTPEVTEAPAAALAAGFSGSLLVAAGLGSVAFCLALWAWRLEQRSAAESAPF